MERLREQWKRATLIARLLCIAMPLAYLSSLVALAAMFADSSATLWFHAGIGISGILLALLARVWPPAPEHAGSWLAMRPWFSSGMGLIGLGNLASAVLAMRGVLIAAGILEVSGAAVLFVGVVRMANRSYPPPH